MAVRGLGARRRSDALGRARRPDAERLDAVGAVIGWLAVIVFVCLTVVPGLLPGRTFIGTDLLQEFAPWNASVDDVSTIAPTNSYSWDTIDGAVPSSALLARSARQGYLAQWNPYSNGGSALAAVPDSAAFSPLSLPWWVLPARVAPAAVKLLEVGATALGMHLLLRRQWRLRRTTVPLATLAYSTSGFMVAWTNWPQTRVAALVPLLLWAVDALAVEATWRRVLPFALVLASMLAGGFPAIVLYCAYVAVPYFLLRSISTHGSWRGAARGIVQGATAAVLGGTLLAFQLLPFAWLIKHQVDFQARTQSASGSLKLQELATVLVPGMFGDVSGGANTWAEHPVEVLSYVGTGTMALAIIGLVHPPRRLRGACLYLGATTALVGAAVYAGGWPLRLLQDLPGIASSPIGRWRSVLACLVVVLAAVGLDAVMASTEARRARSGAASAGRRPALKCATDWVRAIVSVALAALIVVPVVRVTVEHSADADPTAYRWTLIPGALLLVVASLTIVLGRRRPVAVGVVVVAVIALVAAPGIALARSWWPLSATSTFYPVTATHRYLDSHLGQDRYVSIGMTMMSGSSTMYDERALNGHSFRAPTWVELQDAAIVGFSQSQTYTQGTADSLAAGMSSGVLDALGVRYVVASMTDPVPGTRNEPASASGSRTLERGTTARTTSATGPVRGVILPIADVDALTTSPDTLTVRLVDDASGTVLASGSERLRYVAQDHGIAYVAAESIPTTTTWHAELTVSGSGTAPTLAADSDGVVPLGTFTAADGLTLVHAGDAVVLRRDSALHRIRWASREKVVASPTTRLDLLASGDVGADTILLSRASDARKVDGSSTATVSAHDVTTNHQRVSVTSTGPGWVFVGDPMQGNGWTASLDGATTTLVDADHGAVAVYVPSAGRHTIDLVYRPPMNRPGLALSLASLIALVLIHLTATGALQRTLAAGPRAHRTRGSDPWSGAAPMA